MIILLRPIAIKYKLVDLPDTRKEHEGEIPYIGGACVFIGLLFSQIYLNEYNEISILMIISSFILLILGILDDLKNLNAKTKLIFQILLIGVTVICFDIQVKSLGYFFGLSAPLNLGFLAIPFTIIGIGGLINAFNMIDGADGHAGTLIIIAIIGIFLKSLPLEEYMFYYFFLGLISALIPFVICNIFGFYNTKIFLGNGGVLFLGFIISFVLVYNSQNINGFTSTYALWCVAVPLFDFFSVIVLRKIAKRSLFLAGKDHVHHFLKSIGFSKTIILININLLGLTFLFTGYFLENSYPKFSFPVFIILFLVYLSIRLLSNSKNTDI